MRWDWFNYKSQVREDARATFEPDHGQRTLHRILKYCGVIGKQTPEAMDRSGRTDPNGTLVNVGRLDAGQMILRSLSISDDELMEMAREPGDEGEHDGDS